MLQAATLVAAALAGTALGGTGAALRTPAGRQILVRAVLRAANGALDGQLTVGQIGGSFTGGLDARDVVLSDPGGAAVATVPRLQARYRVRDLLGGRVVLGQLELSDPKVVLVQDAAGVLNLERVLRLNQPGNGGPSPLIAFRDVEITGGAVVIRSGGGADGDGAAERTIQDLNAGFSYVRLSSPLPGEHPLRFEVVDLRARVSRPAIDLRGARGTVELIGDSLTLDLEEARFPNSVAQVRGALTWPADTLLYALEVRASRVATQDLQWAVPQLAGGLVGRGHGTLRSQGGDVLEVRLADMALAGGGGGGTLRGTLGLVLGPGRHRALEGTDLTSDNLDLEYVRPLLDTLPLAGRLTGRFQGDGPAERLAVSVDWTFRDSLVPGWPESRVVGDGVVSLDGPDGFVFDDFAVRSATLDLGTVHRLVPIDLRGTLDAAGTLNGPWRQAEFSGTMRHHDTGPETTLARGVLRVDGRGDTLGLWVDFSLDSLRLGGLQPSYPGLAIGGAYAGDVKLSGYLDSLLLQADLSGPAGEVAAQGALQFLGSRRGARWLDAEFSRLDLHRLNDSLPRTSLRGRLRGRASLDTLAAPAASGLLQLAASTVAGTVIDSAAARFTLVDSVLRVDTLALYAPRLVAAGRGGIGVGGSRADTLRLSARTDSVGVLEPFAGWLASAAASPERAPSGAAEATVTLTGTLARFGLVARVRASTIRWGAFRLRGAALAGRWHNAQRGAVELDGTLDSLGWDRFRLGAVEARVRGRPDSLGWFARSRWGDEAAWIAGGRTRSDSLGMEVVIDSLGVLLPSEAWFLTRQTRLVLSDSAIVCDSATLGSASGGAHVGLAGRFPRAGVGDLRLSFEQIPLADVWALLQRDPGEVAGAFSGTVTLGGTAREPLLQGQAALQDGAFRGFRTPYLDGTFDYRARRLGGEFTLWRAGQRVLGITLNLPLDLALQGAPEDRKLPGPLSIRVHADSVDLAFLEAMVPVARQTAGRLSADFGIAGGWDQPRLTGTVGVSGGAVTFSALGVRHRNLVSHLTLLGDTIRVDTLSLQSGDGTAAVSGFVRLAQLTRPLLRLRINAQNFRMMDVSEYLSFTTSGAWALTGPVYGAVLTGRGTVPRGVLYFTDLVTKQVMNLEDVRYANMIDTSLVRRLGLREAFDSRFLDSLRIDSLLLNMGSDVWMRSSEANIQLTGLVTVSKVADRYRLDGTLETPRGTYRLPLTTTVKSEFTVTRGQLQYFGTPDLNAAVDIDARHVVRRPEQNVTVSVHIGGTLYTPRLTLSSDFRPPISETEIISLLLFGTSSFQAVAENGRNQELISTAVSRYAAAAVSSQFERSVITDLGLPLDYLQVRPGDVNVLNPGGGLLTGTEIAAGKQVSVFGLPTFLTLSPRYCPQNTFFENLGWSAELRLSRPWLFALSRDPVGPCSGLGSTSDSARRNQFGLDLFWERIY